MYCNKCGKPLTDGSAFCNYCGASCTESPKKISAKSKILIISMSIVIVCLVVLSTILIINSHNKSTSNNDNNAVITGTAGSGNTSGGDGNDTENASNSGSNNTGAKTTPTVAAPTPTVVTTYTAVSKVTGEEMSVEAGYTYVVYSSKMHEEAYSRAKVLLPSMASFTGDLFTQGIPSEKSTGVLEQYETCERQADLDYFDAYLAFLEENYNVKCINTSDFTGWTSSISAYACSYTGTEDILKNGVTDSMCGECDFYFKIYKGYTSNFISIVYPDTIGFVYTDETAEGITAVPKEEVRQNLVAAVFDNSTYGKDSFKIKGWGASSADYLQLIFASDTYAKGNVYTLEDFTGQSTAGGAALRSLNLYCDAIVDDYYGINTQGTKTDYLKEIRIEILEKSGVTALSFYINVADTDGTTYEIEGVTAYGSQNYDASTGNGGSDAAGGNASSGGSASSGGNADSGGKKCTYCDGTGRVSVVCSFCNGAKYTKCHNCGGDGKEQCPNCHGACQLWSSEYGYYKACTRCSGHGYITCSFCTNGKVTCTSCNGKGVKESTCTHCGGLGKTY